MDAFAGALLAWHRRHGRRDLPWQHPRTPYRVWVAEVMLQQTQVATVIPYFERFMARWPRLPALAVAELDEVLALWSGLGYYRRARQLHAAARRCLAEHGGELPRDRVALTSLPGIGRSTAAAILAQAYGERATILDGNVKRVLARWHAVEGWPGASAVERVLWAHAEAHTPEREVADYTQAVMDLGALLCRPRTPRCDECPVAFGCVARARKLTEHLPTQRPRTPLPQRQAYWWVLRDEQHRLWLERRPPVGVWGSLWCFPIGNQRSDLERYCQVHGFELLSCAAALPEVRHRFTHFEWILTPVPAQVRVTAAVREVEGAWFLVAECKEIGLPAPVRAWITAQHPVSFSFA